MKTFTTALFAIIFVISACLYANSETETEAELRELEHDRIELAEEKAELRKEYEELKKEYQKENLLSKGKSRFFKNV